MNASGVTTVIDNWPTILDRIDRLVAGAGSAYLQGLRARGHRVDTAAWSRELDLLARGRNVDYGLPGLPLMYAIRYMPKRIIALIGELSLADIDPPVSLLDVGVGTGAVPAALRLMWPRASVRVRGIDASAEMLEFALASQRVAGAPATFEVRTLDDLMADRSMLDGADLVTFSAPFNRSFADWDRLAATLTRTGRTLFASEPSSRFYLLDSFEAALRQHGWVTRRDVSDSIPAVMREIRGVPAVTRFWRRIGAPGPYQPQTWWEPPSEQFLVAHR